MTAPSAAAMEAAQIFLRRRNERWSNSSIADLACYIDTFAEARAEKRAAEARREERARQGWKCYHCGESFHTKEAADGHFGHYQDADPACIMQVRDRSLVYTIRDLQAELERYRLEDTDKDRVYHAAIAENAVIARREEEKGYERGLRDGAAEAPPEHPTPEMIAAGVRMHQTPRTGPPETLVHDIWQAMYEEWKSR